MTDHPSPRVLVRADARGAAEGGGHPYEPGVEVHGWTLSRDAGLSRVAVNLGWLPPGKESSPYHAHFHEEEWLYVLEGRGEVELPDGAHAVGPGDFVAFPTGVAHRVQNLSADARLLALMGGEIIPDTEVVDFPRLGRRMVRFGNRFAVYPMDAEIPFIPGVTELPPALFGIPPAADPPRLLVPAGERPAPRTYHHPRNPRSEVALTPLAGAALKRLSVGLAEVPAGHDSYVDHVHHHDEEWMFVLSGAGTVRLGDREEPIGPGDFLGFPPGGPAHAVHAGAGGPLRYVQGGDAWSPATVEVVDYPTLGLRKTIVGTRRAMTFRVDAAVDGPAT